MFQSIWDDVKREFQHGNMVTRIIIANCIVFVVINIIGLFMSVPGKGLGPGFDWFLRLFSMPRNGMHFLTHPWTLITSTFLHLDFVHILWNMLTFYWFGRIVGDLLGNHRILPLYIVGGIVGNLIFFLFANLTPYGSSMTDDAHAYGASAAVMGMVACAAFVAPDYIFHLLFIGPVRLKYIAFALMFLDLIAISRNANTGGSLAHLGGAAMGLAYAAYLRRGIDLGKPISSFITFISQIFSPKKNTKLKYERGEKAYARSERKTAAGKGNRRSDTEGVSDQEKLDRILDKIKERGYESLTKEEKDFLFNASKK
jgi:membrane associated rhomboid family serine protease